jgi:hypothetical protein
MTKKSTNLPVTTSFADEIKEMQERLAANQGDKIKTEGKVFQLPSGATAESLDVVIVDFVYYNSWYNTIWKPGVTTAPQCYAIAVKPKDLAPYDNSPNAQNEMCEGCQKNEWGSREGGGKICQNRILVAVLPADATEKTPLAVLDLPPTSNGRFQKYITALVSALQVPPYATVSQVTFDPSSAQPVPIFSDPQVLDSEQIKVISSRRAEARTRLLTALNIEAIQAANDAKSTGLKAPVARKRA